MWGLPEFGQRSTTLEVFDLPRASATTRTEYMIGLMVHCWKVDCPVGGARRTLEHIQRNDMKTHE